MIKKILNILNYLTHILVKVIKNPKYLLEPKHYLIKLRFHLWPFLSRSKKNKISIFNTILHIESDTFNGRGIYSYRNFKDNDERNLINSEIKPGSICIDIGSNVGFYTVFLLKSDLAKKVYSFESNPNTFEILRQNTKNLNCIQTLGKVGDKTNQIIVDERIDKNEKIDFIKIDLDGEDYFALKSYKKIIGKYKPKILIEISESSERIQGVSFLEVIKYLNEFGYKIYYANKNLKEFKKLYLNKDQVINLFCK